MTAAPTPGGTMRAVGVRRALPVDDPECLVDLVLPVPQAGAHDLLVRIEAVAVNPADYRARMRKADDGEPAVLGWDAAGTVVAVGAQAGARFAPGDAVYYAGALERPGANSEYHAVDARIVAHRPRTLAATQSAALPLTALTAWEALFDRLGLRLEGGNRLRSLLVVGGAGGTASMALQLARLVPDITVIGTASRPESRAWCLRMGAHDVLDHLGDLRAQLAERGRATVDAVLLLNDPDRHFPVLAELLAPQGALCCVVPFDRPPELNALMRKSASFSWEFMFTRPMFATADIARQGEILAEVASLVDAGRLLPVTTKVLQPIDAARLREAHRLLETRRTIGKIALQGF